jgi:hypothetical protein
LIDLGGGGGTSWKSTIVFLSTPGKAPPIVLLAPVICINCFLAQPE